MQSCDRGYLDVAIAKKIVSETCKKRSQKYLVSESRGEPCACSSHVPIEGHTCCSTLLFKLTLSGSFTYYCVFMLPCVFIMQCILFSYLNSVIVINQHELIQVALLLHMTVHKRKNWPKFFRHRHSLFSRQRSIFYEWNIWTKYFGSITTPSPRRSRNSFPRLRRSPLRN